jgi:DNA-binding NarL/FixJ family response regulator
MPLRVLIADDHPIVRQGTKAILECEGFEVAGEATNGQEAIDLALTLAPDVVVLDLSMPVLSGLAAVPGILRVCPRTRVILLTMHSLEHHVVTAIQAGVRGYVLKTQAAKELVHAIREVVRGEVYLSPGVSRIFVEGYLSQIAPSSDGLAPRERQVLQLVAEGKTSKEIAALLNLTVKTAESYRARIMEKLDIHDTPGLVRYAIRHGVIEA